jgi:hypothetical protein
LPALVERSDGVSDCLNFKLSFFLTLLTNYKHGECLSYVGTEGLFRPSPIDCIRGTTTALSIKSAMRSNASSADLKVSAASFHVSISSMSSF